MGRGVPSKSKSQRTDTEQPVLLDLSKPVSFFPLDSGNFIIIFLIAAALKPYHVEQNRKSVFYTILQEAFMRTAMKACVDRTVCLQYRKND